MDKTMRTALKILLLGRVILIAWIFLNGCTLMPPPGSDFEVILDPTLGHPPFTVEIKATDMGRGTYTYEMTGKATVQSSENAHSTVVRTWPWSCKVTWTDGLGGFREDVAAVDLENTAPVIHWPRVNGIDPNYNACTLRDRQRYVFNLNYYETEPFWPGDQIQRFGILDFEGDDCEIVEVEVIWFGDPYPEGRKVSVYTPPYESGVYHTTRDIGQSEILPNSFILYPPYLGAIHKKTGRLMCPTPEWTYTWDRCKPAKIPYSNPAPLTIRVEVKDEYGAHSERTFEFVMDATGCNK